MSSLPTGMRLFGLRWVRAGVNASKVLQSAKLQKESSPDPGVTSGKKICPGKPPYLHQTLTRVRHPSWNYSQRKILKLLVIKEMQVKSTMRFCYTPT